METEILWWGYLHIDGTIHVKVYFEIDDLIEAFHSDFVQRVGGPWKVNNREEALKKMREVLDGN